MTEPRLILETPCIHGWDDLRRHWIRADGTNTLWPSEAADPEQEPCPGGGRRLIEIDFERLVELLHQTMGHLDVASDNVARSISDQAKRVEINKADQKVAEVWSGLRAALGLVNP